MSNKISLCTLISLCNAHMLIKDDNNKQLQCLQRFDFLNVTSKIFSLRWADIIKCWVWKLSLNMCIYKVTTIGIFLMWYSTCLQSMEVLDAKQLKLFTVFLKASPVTHNLLGFPSPANSFQTTGWNTSLLRYVVVVNYLSHYLLF